MSMIIVSTGKNLTRWIDALKSADPSLDVQLPEQVTNKKAIRFALSWNHPRGIFSEYPNLECISSFGAGVDHILSDPDIPANVKVVRIVDPLLSADMAEFALAVVMSNMRRLPEFMKLKQEKTWKKRGYMRMAETRVGIMGTGVIGHHVATELHRVGLKVSGWSRTAGTQVSYTKFNGQEQLSDFLARLDFLICLLPLTPRTKGIINKDLLAQLPAGAFLINLGRGAHLVDHDLIQMIDQKHISGAHLDVFDPEPLPEDHPFWAHPAIHITPHVASLTDPESVAPQVVNNYRRLIENKELLNTVSRQAGY